MNDQSNMLYKLMIMYMLNKVDFPLSNNQISSFMLGKQYTNYFTLQSVLNSLIEDDFIHPTLYQSSTQYSLTDKGRESINFFYNKVSSSIRNDIESYLSENKYELRCEVSTTAEYYKSTTGEYIVICKATEGKNVLIELKLSVPIKEEAEIICSKWKTNNQSIYEYLMHKLL